MTKETRERTVIRILMLVARILARSLPTEVQGDLKQLSTHLAVAQYEDAA